MSHDPLCEWSTPCIHGESQQHSRDTENLAVPDATYCWMCGADCTCDLIAKARKDMLAKCIAALSDSQAATYPSEFSDGYDLAYAECRAALAECRAALRALQEKPTTTKETS